MKFESKFGIGEIVIYAPHVRSGANNPPDQVLEIQAVSFAIDGTTSYWCRYPATGVTAVFAEQQLEGDPDFDQETGYPTSEDER